MLFRSIILIIFLTALGLSSFDEGFQYFFSSRIFDICDIAKDSWGTVIGIIFVFMVYKNGEILKGKIKVREKKFKEYFKNPIAVLVFEMIFAYLLLSIGSLLTDISYFFVAVGITVLLFLIIFFVTHYSQNKIFKRTFWVLCVIVLIAQSISFFIYRNEGIVYNTKGLTIYKGIPIPYFDIMIYQNGFFRLVDKKLSFNKRDIDRISSYYTDILMIGSGSGGQGGRGFNISETVQNPYFVYNSYTNKGLQVIVLKTPEACYEYNQLIKRKKNVIFIIHNT